MRELEASLREVLGDPLPGENHNDRFEAIAAEFHRDTGHLRPGKSLPLEMGHASDEEARELSWKTWIAARNARVVEHARSLLTGAAREEK